MYESNFKDVQADYENQLKLLESTTKSYETKINALAAKGYLENTKYYEELQKVERQNIALLQKELSELNKLFAEAMASGEIHERSEAWYNFKISINDVSSSIEEANVKLLEYQKTMREVEWGYFDYVQERIAQITDESEFLINILENSNLYNEQGKFNDNARAATGLHAQNYNVYMSQADQYAKELSKIDKQIANDKYNTDLVKRREELLELQRKSILAAEDEKKAVSELVENGIKVELDALRELINAYTDSLDEAKDLYEYQKKINEQTSNIASLQKQLSAYENDTSEEGRLRVQKLRNSLEEAQQELEETEYDQFIADAKKLLDGFYDDYEGVLNERLDDIDALMWDMIDMVNYNSSNICETLQTISSELGYTMTDNMVKTWQSGGAANTIVTKYCDNFTSQLTSINQVINAISANVTSMVSASAGAGAQSGTSTSSQAKPAAQSTSVATKATTTSAATVAKAITVGGKINAGNAKIYAYVGSTKGLNQYYASDPIYTVLQEKNGYIQVRHHNLKSGVTGWFKKSDVKAYKTGGLVDYTGIAQVHGSAQRPESIFNAKDTENLISLRDSMRSMPYLTGINDISRLASHVLTRNIGNNGSGYVFNIPIQIDHVEDYNDFVSKLQNDKTFERLITSMTVDRLAGSSSLSKNKYSWQ